MAFSHAKTLNRLSRSSLIDLILTWIEQHPNCPPYLVDNRSLNEVDEEDYLYPPAESVWALKQIYEALKREEDEVSKKDIVDRIVDGDWRRGLSLQQLAMIDFAYLEQNDTALRWSALKVVPLEREQADESELPPTKRRKVVEHPLPKYPQTTISTFVATLKAEISPLVKAHYFLHRLPPPSNLSVLRLYISPNSAFGPKGSKISKLADHTMDLSRVVYIALPDSCPYIYVALSGSANSTSRRNSSKVSTMQVDMAVMKKIILEAIPKALSRPQERWALQSTKLVAKSLKAICQLRGNGRVGSGGGAYSVFVKENQESKDRSPVEIQPRSQETKNDIERTLDTRFGFMDGQHHAALDRVHVKIENLVATPAVTSNESSSSISLTFSGLDVFRGLKELAQLGPSYLDLDKVPAWMTGEEGVTSLIV